MKMKEIDCKQKKIQFKNGSRKQISQIYENGLVCCFVNLFILSTLINTVTSRTYEDSVQNIETATSMPPSNTTPTLSTSTELPENENGCFWSEPDICQLPNDNENCKECMFHPTIKNSLVCCNVTDIEKSLSCFVDNSSIWENLHIRNATLDELDFSHKFWKQLKTFAVTDGQITRVNKEFSKFSSPTCVNISNNNILSIPSRAFKEVPQLQYLDLSNNNLSMLPILNGISSNLTLDLRGNLGMLCKSILESTERNGVYFLDPDDNTTCLSNQTFHWFNSTDRMSLTQLVRMKQLNIECPPKCRCEPERMGYEPTLIFHAKVDCSNISLTELPIILPHKTTTLNVARNNITNLNALNENPAYLHLLRLDIDDNQISSLNKLEASKFIESFESFSIRRNQLKTIPTYILSNTLDKSPDRMLFLEGNNLFCDCNTAKYLKLWLMARQSHIPDVDKIGCENMKQKVKDLSEVKLCQSQHDWTDYIYYLITLEILLLMAMITKVSYDYWVFKTAGYLPWPASKMPKLPCDWLCET